MMYDTSVMIVIKLNDQWSKNTFRAVMTQCVHLFNSQKVSLLPSSVTQALSGVVPRCRRDPGSTQQPRRQLPLSTGHRHADQG